jgi:hypothetical protein
MPLILGSNTPTAGGFAVDNSCRFNRGSSDYLNKTFSGAGNRTTWTISVWVKRANELSTNSYIIDSGAGNGTSLYFGSEQIEFWDYQSGAYTGRLTTNAVFRDMSAWYHIVAVWDTTNGTAGDRMRLYVNGVEETSFATDTNPSSSQNSILNDGSTSVTIGKQDSIYTNLYMAEFCYIDGQALDPTSFGEFDEDSGIWKPIDVSGLTFGTNGFYLDFEDSAALGDDVSGNGNDFTVNNLTAIDQTTDTPTNNFCTLNALIGVGGDAGNKQVLSEGNLYVTGNQASWCHSRGTMSYSVGKWYWEAKITGKILDMNIGVSNTGTNLFFGTAQSQSGNTTIYTEGDKNINGTITYGVFAAYSLGDIIGIAHNADANTVTFYKNGSAILSDQSVSGGNDTTWTPASAVYNTTGFFSFNFGSPIYSANSYTDGAGYGNFSYAVPSGYYALNTKNLAEFG